jgi:Holliday junction DNA helicase RuvA
MISLIMGCIVDTTEDAFVVATGGMGFQVFVPVYTRARFKINDEIRLFTHLIVREDLLALYGFETNDERIYFKLLLGVNGIGPRTALAIISTLSVETIRKAVLSEQEEIFGRVPGVGKKSGQKIVLYLQGKIPAYSGVEEAAKMADVDGDVLDALTNLGYSIVEAQAAIQSIPHDTPQETEIRLRIALQYFSS